MFAVGRPSCSTRQEHVGLSNVIECHIDPVMPSWAENTTTQEEETQHAAPESAFILILRKCRRVTPNKARTFTMPGKESQNGKINSCDMKQAG